MATHTIAIANQKGGVGKTTTAINLGHGLARHGKQVLLLDFDPQGQVASVLGMHQEMGTYHLLSMGSKSRVEQAFIRQWVRASGRENLWLIAGNQETAAAQTNMAARALPLSHVREALELFTDSGLDYIIMDTSPSVGGLQERALWAADLVLIPAAMENQSNEGVRSLIEMLEVLHQHRQWRGSLLGILPTFYDQQTRQSQVALQQLRQAFGSQTLAPIHRATILREAAAEGKSIFEKDHNCRSAREYDHLARQVLKVRQKAPRADQ